MWVVAADLKVFSCEVVDLRHRPLDLQFGEGSDVPLKLHVLKPLAFLGQTGRKNGTETHLFFQRFGVVDVDVGVAQSVNKIPGLETGGDVRIRTRKRQESKTARR